MAAIDVYQGVKSLILNGEIQPGSVMIERVIAEKLGVSRVPVREAFKRLLCEGLLITRDGKGLFTRTYNEQTILDLYVYRETLDGLATRLFTMRVEPMQVDYLEMLYGEMVNLRDHYERHGWEQRDIEFHQIILRGTRNERVIRAANTIYEECFYLNRTFCPEEQTRGANRGHLDDVIGEHRRILDAIAARDSAAAEEAARESVRRATARLMNGFAARSRSLLAGAAPRNDGP